MDKEIEKRVITPSEVIAGLKSDLVQRVPEGTEIKFEIHYHAGAPAPDTRAVADPMAPAARLAPYFVILLGGAIILAIIAVIVIMLVPAIMALATMIGMVMIGFALAAVAVAAAVRSLRYSKHDASRHE